MRDAGTGAEPVDGPIVHDSSPKNERERGEEDEVTKKDEERHQRRCFGRS